MADSIAQLKNLLFEREAATLSELAHRIDQVGSADIKSSEDLAQRLATLAQQVAAVERGDQQARSQISERLDTLAQRVGTPEALRSSVALVLDDAIVEAREDKHDQLTRAIAPLVIRTVKNEIKNNQDEMVQVLYPITGRLVKAYVASEMKDLMRRMNRSMEQNGAMLWFRSMVSGYSRAELTLADTQQLQIEELYLIRRGSGELIQRWPEGPALSNTDVHMSGIIAAINDFAGHAFQSDGGNLRSFELDDLTVFLRASPVYLLAAKCRGTALTGVERLIDGAFVEAVAQYHEAPGDTPVAPLDAHAAAPSRESAGNEGAGRQAHEPEAARLLSELQERLEQGIAAQHEVVARAGLWFNPLKAVATLLVLGLLAGAGWYGWTTIEASRTRVAAQAVVDDTADLKGFPVLLDVGYRGRNLTVSGLAPSDPVRELLLGKLRAALPGVAVAVRGMGALPAGGPDVRPQIAAVRRELVGLETSVRTDVSGLQSTVERDLTGLKGSVQRDLSTLERELTTGTIGRSLDRARRRLELARIEMRRLAGSTSGRNSTVPTETTAVIDTTLQLIDKERSRLTSLKIEGLRQPDAARALVAATERLVGAADRVGQLIAGPGAFTGTIVRSSRRADDAPSAAEELGLAAERLATIAAAAAQAGSIRLPPSTPARALTAREKLQAFARANAVFFGNQDEFREPRSAKQVLDDLAALMRDNNIVVRLVGYTDERGGVSRNSEVAQLRADAVQAEMSRRGVAERRLIAIGRASGPVLSPLVGLNSPNRRVEFELAFDGEAAAQP